MEHMKFHTATSLMRGFFLSKWCIEVHPQCRRSILAACEDPSTIWTYERRWQKWPLPQTGQMRLEYELLNQPDVPGFFCVSTSYRNEPNPVEWRHKTIFPMFEFELKGNMEELVKWEKELCERMWFEGSARISYDAAKEHYQVQELEHEHENDMDEDFHPITFLTDFPIYTSPFWNMKKDWDHAKKVDVIMYGMETIWSAERSCNPEEMRDQFYSISQGWYAQTIIDHFGKERVEKELTEFLSFNFFPRSWGWIWVDRMISAMEKAWLFEKEVVGNWFRLETLHNIVV